MSLNILFLGTGADDRRLLPQEKDFIQKDKRRCSAAIVNGHILFDCGPHIINALTVAKIEFSAITDIVLTHLHKDHFDVNSVNAIAKENPDLRLWFREDSVFTETPKCKLIPMKLFEEYSVGELLITAVPANHSAYPQHISVKCGEKSLFYGLDGGWFLNESVRYMKNKEYDIFITDATVGDYIGDFRIGEHNSIPMIRMMVPSLKTLNIINKNTKIVLSHLAVCLHKPHEEICRQTESDGFVIAYDGLELLI